MTSSIRKCRPRLFPLGNASRLLTSFAQDDMGGERRDQTPTLIIEKDNRRAHFLCANRMSTYINSVEQVFP